MEFRGQVAKTNLSSNTAMRGFGGPQGMVIIEEIMDRVARATGLPPEVGARAKPLSRQRRDQHHPLRPARRRQPHRENLARVKGIERIGTPARGNRRMEQGASPRQTRPGHDAVEIRNQLYRDPSQPGWRALFCFIWTARRRSITAERKWDRVCTPISGPSPRGNWASSRRTFASCPPAPTKCPTPPPPPRPSAPTSTARRSRMPVRFCARD